METELKYEEKFIVINRKRLEEMEKNGATQSVNNLLHAIDVFTDRYKSIAGKPMDQKYLVCNQDEPYAKKVLDLILHRNPQEKQTKKRIKHPETITVTLNPISDIEDRGDEIQFDDGMDDDISEQTNKNTPDEGR